MDKIDTVLLELCVSPAILGFIYLKSALGLCASDPSIVREVTKRLYPQIALEHNATPSQVERTIRHAVEASWSGIDAQSKKKYFVADRLERPTNSNYIATLAIHLRDGV